ncbi:MAG: hypothetical protein AMXMBFR34_27330 [Myxococcaceae bacterium]
MVRALFVTGTPPHPWRPTSVQLAWIVALICGVAPLWASQALPLVDLPQHLHLISVLHRLDDPSTLYPEYFARRPQLTPYLGYYYTVSLLNWLMPLELANRLFLSAYVAGLPLSLGFLLKSLKRPTWPALLALPFAYGDSLAWGFINYCAALPLAFLTCGFFVRAIEDAQRRKAWAIALGITLALVLLFHVQVFAWLGLALPLLLLTTPAPEGRTWRARRHALAGVTPAVVLFLVWVGIRLSQPAEIAPGQPWKAWGPLLSEQNLAWRTFEQNVSQLITVPKDPQGGAALSEVRFPLLAGTTGRPEEQRAVRLVFLLALAGVVLAAAKGRDTKEGPVARWRIVALAALAFVLYFALPFDIRGYMYALNMRYAHLAAALLVAAVPPLKEAWANRLAWAGALAAIVLMLPLRSAFMEYGEEERTLEELAAFAAPKPKVMGLVFNTGSRAVAHPVYLHAAAVIARERGGLTNFSFALTPHSPLMYKVPPPPTFPSEWRPNEMRWEEQGRYYDHFVLRGVRPEQIFGARMQAELFVAGQVGDWVLVRRR